MKISVLYNSRNLLFTFSLLLYLFLMPSCKKAEEAKGINDKIDEKIHETIERGPVKVTLEVDKKEITIAGQLNLSISIDIDEEYEVEFPSFGDKLEQFGIVDYHTAQPELKGNKRKSLKRFYLLEPFLSGDYIIKPMKIMFFKMEDKEKHSIETPEVLIKVKSLLASDIEELRLNDIIPPLAYPRSYRAWVWAGTVALILILVTGGLCFYRKRAGKDIIAIRLKAHEIAYNELRSLVDENLIDKGEIKQFFLRLSSITRRYIENRFGLRAPEQTTEEFLKGLERAQDFPDQYKPLLGNFLRYCDLVKFARYTPETKEIQQSFDSCRAFIQGTEEQD
ncbi:MAG: protein BatD [Deltaproteobacteria bacterium]|nr:protein BatD [Deltaproteobacteria bacterium]